MGKAALPLLEALCFSFVGVIGFGSFDSVGASDEILDAADAAFTGVKEGASADSLGGSSLRARSQLWATKEIFT